MLSAKQYKIGKTACLVTVWICFGMIHAVGSPTLPDFRDRLHTTMEDLVLALGFRNFGALLGSITFGILADRYRRKADIIMGVAVIISGLAASIMPVMGSLVLVGVVSFCGGIGQGGIETVGQGILQWMWGEKSSAPFHAIHMGYPIGSTIAPLIAIHFLGPDREEVVNNTTNMSAIVDVKLGGCSDSDGCTSVGYDIVAESVSVTSNYSDLEEVVSRIEVPYAITGGITCLVGLFFLVWIFVEIPKDMTFSGVTKTTLLQILSPKSCRSMGSTGYTCAILVLVCTFYVFVNAKDGTLSTYIFSFAVESELKFKKKEAAILDTVYRATEIVGRALGMVIAHWCPIQPMIFVEVFSNAIFTACLAFLGTKNKTYLWIFACLFKLTAAPIWPSGMSWMSKYLEFSAMVVALTQVVIGVTGYFFDWFGGYLYDNVAPSAFTYYGMCCGFILVVVLTSMQLVASCCKNQQSSMKEEQGPDDSVYTVISDQKNPNTEETPVLVFSSTSMLIDDGNVTSVRL